MLDLKIGSRLKWQSLLLVLALGGLTILLWRWAGASPEHGVIVGSEEIAISEGPVKSDASDPDLQRVHESDGGTGINREVLEEVAVIANRKIFDEGGLDRSLELLEQLHKRLVESGEDAPFQRSVNELQRYDGAVLPTDEALWMMSVESMEISREILMAHANWIQKYSLQPSSSDLDETRAKMTASPLSLPPEAIAMAITKRTWGDLIEEVPSLPVSLGRIRAQTLDQFGEKYTDIWCIQSLVYQAAIEAGVGELEGEGRTLLESLGKLYPPLGELSRDLEALPFSYLQAVETELLASGLVQVP